jgi:hypothetical protein
VIDKEKRKMLELRSTAGFHISHTSEAAVKMANEHKDSVHFEFNGTHVTVQPGESPEAVVARWTADYEAAAKAWRESPERAIEEAKREADLKEKMAAHMIESAQTDAELRDARVPWPYTKEQLVEYIESLVNRDHDYGTCVYAMSMAAEAAFNYVSHRLGVTGFQSSCADLDFVRRTRLMNGPFLLIKAEDALYPQYDLTGRLVEAIEKWKPWLKEEAEKLLKDTNQVHPDVKHHWQQLVQ